MELIILMGVFNDFTCFLNWLLLSIIPFLLGLLLGWALWSRYRSLWSDVSKERDRLHTSNVEFEKDLASEKYKLEEANKELDRTKIKLRSTQADLDMVRMQLKAIQDENGGGVTIVPADMEGLKKQITDLEAAVKQCEEEKAALQEQLGGDGGTVVGSTDGPTNVAAINYGGIFESDNLQIVEGIGPKIEELLKAAGITTWGALAAADTDKLKGILEEAGSRYRMHDPSSWAQQAKLADEGKWDELVQFQKFLDGGSGKKGDFESPSKIEKLGMKILGFSNNPEDLKIVEGIGPKIEGLLKDAGINNWSELAATSVDRIKEILTAAGDRYRLAEPATWPKQAQLAAEGKWSELSEYQDFLDGGKEPE